MLPLIVDKAPTVCVGFDNFQLWGLLVAASKKTLWQTALHTVTPQWI